MLDRGLAGAATAESGETGTTVCFKPDLEIFTGGIVFDYATLRPLRSSLT